MALAALKPNNLPTPIQEEWKYTNLPKALPQGLQPDQKIQDIVIHRNRGQNGGEPVNVTWNGEDGMLHNPRLKLVLEEGAEVTLIERHSGAGSYWKNAVTEISVANNATLYHYRIQEDSEQGVHTNMVSINLGRDAVYESFSLNTGGKLTRHQIHMVMKGVNGECTFNGINLLKGTQHGDTTILIEHTQPHGRSNQFYRTLLDDTSKGVFQGKVHVHQPAQKTDGYQLSNAIILSEGAEMYTKPELEIYADDVKCSHGATTGQLDEEPMFYLRSRGLQEKEARLLLVQAFINEVIDKVANESFREEVRGKAQSWLDSVL
jgi:Fe-S cluster assembly protein SufD